VHGVVEVQLLLGKASPILFYLSLNYAGINVRNIPQIKCFIYLNNCWC